MIQRSSFLLSIAVAFLIAATPDRSNAEAPPVWLTGISIGVKEGLDTDIFGVSTNLAGHPDIANVSSWFTTVSAKLTLDVLKAAETPSSGFLQTLTLGYAADYTAYDAVAREDNLRNTLTLELRGKSGPWSGSIDNPLLYVDGSKQDQFYNTYDNLGYGPTRERRNQIQERNNSFVRYDAQSWFARVVDSATYFNLLIDEHDPIGAYKGYANWVNRDDVNAGVDLGYKFTPDFAFVAGWRVGQQTQARLNYSPVDNDNTYNRALFGVEGNITKWLQLQATAGPDFRRYSDGASSGIAGNRHTWLYTQGQATVVFSPGDTLALSNKVWHFVSSAGTSSIQETTYSATYQHTFSQRLTASAGLLIFGHRYDFPALRDDWTRAFPIDVTYAITRAVSLSADYLDTSGASHYAVAVTPGQNFSDNIVSLSVKVSF